MAIICDFVCKQLLFGRKTLGEGINNSNNNICFFFTSIGTFLNLYSVAGGFCEDRFTSSVCKN